MADITHNDPVVTESKLTEFYNDIKPFLGCPAYLTSEGTSDYYSTDEKVIGRWIDGKPLYQKTINGILNNTTADRHWVTIIPAQNMANVDILQAVPISYIIDTDGTTYPIASSTFFGSGNPFSGAGATATALKMDNGALGMCLASLQVGNLPYSITIKYTKTTDSAATTIQEDPNEYSTTEKIVGKWVDGKPLYQKTIVGVTAATAYNWVQIPIGANIDFSMLKDLTIPAGGGGGSANATVDFFYPSVGEDLSTYVRAVIWTDREASASSKNCFGVYTKFNGSVPFYATIQYTKITD